MEITAKPNKYYPSALNLTVKVDNNRYEIYVSKHYFSVVRYKNGKKNSIQKMGKTFFTLKDICDHYKPLNGKDEEIQKAIDKTPRQSTTK